MNSFARNLLFTVVSIGLVGTAFADDMKKKDAPVVKKEPAPAPKKADKSLYDRLGGGDAIKAVVHEFVANVAADKRINKYFAKTDVPKLEKALVDQIGQATGGPNKYTGKSMADAHKGMKLTEADFTALVEDLVKALDKFKVPAKERGELLTPLAAMKGDIVGK